MTRKKKREMAGNSAKRRKIREYSFNYINFEKEKLQSPFLPFFFFLRKKQNHFFLKLSNFQQLKNISTRLYFLGERSKY